MQVGVFAKTFPGTDPLAVLAACKAAGFDSVQYNFACSGLASLPQSIPDGAAAQVARAAQETGVKIAAVSATYNMTDPDAARRQAGRRAFEVIATNARNLGTDLVTVCSGSLDPADQWRRHPDNDDPSSWTDMCREFEFVLGHAEARGLVIGVEPEHANIVSSARKASRLLEEFPGSPIRIVLDPANLLEAVAPDRRAATLTEALDLLGPAVVLAHAKDRFEDGRVAPAGEGIVDWVGFLSGLKQSGFEGHLVAHGMSAEAAPVVAGFLRNQLGRL